MACRFLDFSISVGKRMHRTDGHRYDLVRDYFPIAESFCKRTAQRSETYVSLAPIGKCEPRKGGLERVYWRKWCWKRQACDCSWRTRQWSDSWEGYPLIGNVEAWIIKMLDTKGFCLWSVLAQSYKKWGTTRCLIILMLALMYCMLVAVELAANEFEFILFSAKSNMRVSTRRIV